MAQCDMGKKVAKSQEEWETILYAINRLHWEVLLDGLAPCMKKHLNSEFFKYEKHE